MNDEALIKFCFSIFDIDKGGSLDMAELDALVRMLTGEDEIRGELKKSLDNIDADGDGEVSLEEMYGYNKEFPESLNPRTDLTVFHKKLENHAKKLDLTERIHMVQSRASGSPWVSRYGPTFFIIETVGQ